jgi:hypothetical protein
MRNSLRRLSAAALVAASSFTVACRDQDVEVDGGNVKHASLAKRDTSRALGPGDIRVATTDSALEVALIGDSLVAGLGAATRNKIKAATDTASVSGNGIGASLEKMIKSTVAGALDHEVRVPLSEISDVTYEDGMLVFYDRNGKRMKITNKDRNGEKSRFAESDAQQFIAAFRAKTRRI